MFVYIDIRDVGTIFVILMYVLFEHYKQISINFENH